MVLINKKKKGLNKAINRKIAPLEKAIGQLEEFVSTQVAKPGQESSIIMPPIYLDDKSGNTNVKLLFWLLFSFLAIGFAYFFFLLTFYTNQQEFTGKDVMFFAIIPTILFIIMCLLGILLTKHVLD